jgi:hypothetical protein
VDTIGALLMGYDPHAIPYLQMAQEQGLGVGDPAQIEIEGVPLDAVRRDFPVPYGDSPARRADAEPPSVTVEVAWVGDPGRELVVDARADDERGIARVELFLDEGRIARLYAAPYRFRLGADLLSSGERRIKAVAYDVALNSAQAQTSVSVPLPTVTPNQLPDTTTPSPVPDSPTPTVTAWPSSTPTPSPLPTPTPLPKPSSTATASPAAESPLSALPPTESAGAASEEPTSTAASPSPAPVPTAVQDPAGEAIVRTALPGVVWVLLGLGGVAALSAMVLWGLSTGWWARRRNRDR